MGRSSEGVIGSVGTMNVYPYFAAVGLGGALCYGIAWCVFQLLMPERNDE